MSVKLQRLNTSKVANVGAKAKVWPDEQYRWVVWLSRAEVVGSGKSRSREEEGGSVYYYISPAIQIRIG